MTLLQAVQAAVRAGELLPSAAENLLAFAAAQLPQWAGKSIEELVRRGEWAELNDRFYRYLEFGTGGMRGRTIGRASPAAERGRPGPLGEPEHAAIGSNMLNDFTLVRATIGLFRHTRKFLSGRGETGRPRLVIAHDVRFFSRHFCELAASAWTRLGGDAFIFHAARPTPQLSYSVIWLRANAGVVITASHNPSHDNGFKAYFEDGGQVVPPHDSAIVAEVNAVPLCDLTAFLEIDLAKVTILGRPADDAYLTVAAKAALDPAVFRRAVLRVALSNIHGTGAVHCPTLLLHAGCHVSLVKDQLVFDPRFPTVKSPNPENAEALSRAIALAEHDKCDLVLATDPDCDRMGCAVRGRSGTMELLTGNQIGAMLAEYRLAKYKELGWIPPAGTARACIITTFVTSRLQNAIGRKHGVKVIETLTGFKWIAAKLHKYEENLKRTVGPECDYDQASPEQRARLQLRLGTFFVFGSEESYGYLPNDMVRDKDGNAACLMMAELCAWLQARGMTAPEFLDEIFVRYGFYLEGVINLYYEGATGSEKIKRILESYRTSPPGGFGGVAVARFKDFGRETIVDEDGDEIPKQDLYVLTLANGYSFAARGSGTEPKMKFYLFANEKVAGAAELPAVKARVAAELERLKVPIEADAKARAEGLHPITASGV